MDPPILVRERDPERCPSCRAGLDKVAREDIESYGIEEPEDYEDGAWGLMRCSGCGRLVQWEA